MTTDIIIVFVAAVVFAIAAVCATAVIVHRESKFAPLDNRGATGERRRV